MARVPRLACAGFPLPIARAGYAALAVDLFGGRNRPPCTFHVFAQHLLRQT